ncbi:DnaD domain protein [Paenibacillus psychroresistens]|uniref:DnaD domain protein n=2 Tax=Paenibacillus psychroresistens TaxID=1778678 RepID=A0A6B8RZ98_9BACL|nr:DnaD domain protein [Paenibacillus psychroresistens]
MKTGNVNIPLMLLQVYSILKLSDLEAMLIIQLIAYTSQEDKEFPTVEEIQARLSSSQEQVIKALQKLLKDQWIAIEERIDPISGIQYERYDLDGVLIKLSEYISDEMRKQNLIKKKDEPKEGKDIFSIIEREFARPLTPMELEMVTNWLDKDQYKEELILAALKEAVFAGKVHFNYLDRILLEWSRNRVFTVEQAKEHSQKFRQNR